MVNNSVIYFYFYVSCIDNVRLKNSLFRDDNVNILLIEQWNITFYLSKIKIEATSSSSYYSHCNPTISSGSLACISEKIKCQSKF